MFCGRDPITILRCMDQFKRACDSSKVSEELAVWILPYFTKEGPRASPNNLLVPIESSRDAYARPENGNDKIGTIVEAVNHLLRSYTANANIAKDTSEIGHLERCTTNR